MTALNEMIVVVYTYAATYTFGSTTELNQLVGSKQSVISTFSVSIEF